jgi:lipoate-protein ligase A
LRGVNLRWLPFAEGEAAWNMAVDEAILESHLQGRSPTTLRFYGWAPPAVSIGYAQRIDPQVVSDITSRGFSVVRRPTGGRAVLHQGDLTYSYVGSSSAHTAGQTEPIDRPTGNSSSDTSSSDTSLPDNSLPDTLFPNTNFGTTVALLPPSVSKSYLQICEGLIEGLKRLGIEAEIGRGKGGYNRFQDCFQSTTSADLQVDGLKVVGSAQLRRKHAVLQHGSILLNQDQLLMPQLLSGSTKAQSSSSLSSSIQSNAQQPDPTRANPTRPDPRHCNVFDLIGVLPIQEIEQAFLEGFCHTNGQRFERGTLTDFEIELAKTLLPKYLITP